MSTSSNLPLALYKANLDLWLRIGELVQDNQHEWLELLTQSTSEDVGKVIEESNQVLLKHDWASLPAVPAESLWQGIESQLAHFEAAAQTAIGNQTTFATGFQQALADWQAATAEALGEAAESTPFASLFESLPDFAGSLLATTTDVTETTAKAARKTVAKTTKAVKKATRKAVKQVAKKVPAKAAKKAAPSP